ncbi:MAG: hypothetical protein N2508_16350 [Anaerolineae bacterium]|nr:hypothetical protein [Anaerolineae bacterium]
MVKAYSAALWTTRLVLAVVFFWNVSCALAFIVDPAAYVAGFELAGVAGEVLVRGMGILFLMWNATYPLAIWHPGRYRHLLLIVMVQQLIGVVGETWMWLTLPPGHDALALTGQRFILFDALGLALMVIALVFMAIFKPRSPA